MTESAGEKTVAMMVWNTCEHDSRVIKEATTLASAGYRVRVVCLAADDLPELETRDRVTYQRVRESLGPVRALFRRALTSRGAAPSAAKKRIPYRRRVLAGAYRVATFRLALATMGEAVASLRPSVIHAHDVQMLPAAAKLARRLGAALVYDTHELATEVSFRPPRPLRWLIKRNEGRAIREADLVLTVSPGIAEHLQEQYGIPPPVVLFNSPPIAGERRTGRTVRDDLGLDEEIPLVLYVGALDANRGLEETVDALGLLPDFHLACVGPRHAGWEDDMYARARAARAEDRLHFLDPVPSEELVCYLSSANVGVIAIQNICLSYSYTMPNKLFETVLAGVPVVASDLSHLRDFVDRHQVGRVADESDPVALAQAMREVAARADLRPEGERLERLRQEFGWEAQGQRLRSVYGKIVCRRATWKNF